MKNAKTVDRTELLEKWVLERPEEEHPHIDYVYKALRDMRQGSFWQKLMQPRASQSQIISARLAALERSLFEMTRTIASFVEYAEFGYEEMWDRVERARSREARMEDLKTAAEKEVGEILGRVQAQIQDLERKGEENLEVARDYKAQLEAKEREIADALASTADRVGKIEKLAKFGRDVIEAGFLFDFEKLLKLLPNTDGISIKELEDLIELQNVVEDLLPRDIAATEIDLRGQTDLDLSVLEGEENVVPFPTPWIGIKK